MAEKHYYFTHAAYTNDGRLSFDVTGWDERGSWHMIRTFNALSTGYILKRVAPYLANGLTLLTAAEWVCKDIGYPMDREDGEPLI